MSNVSDRLESFRDWDRISWRLAAVLRELAEGKSLAACAYSLGLSYHGIRSDVERLKRITGASSAYDLGAWWRGGARLKWARAAMVAAGVIKS